MRKETKILQKNQITQEIFISPQECKSEKYDPFLLAIDLGGTKIDAAVCSKKIGEKKWQILFVHTFETKKVQNIDHIFDEMQTFFFSEYHQKYTSACIGIAGPLTQDRTRANVTNVGWNLSSKKLQKKYKLSSLIFLNDLEAVGKGITSLTEKDLLKLDNLPLAITAQSGILAAGTGLGVATISPIINQNDFSKKTKETIYAVHPAEAGHIPFTTITQEDELLQKYLSKKLKRKVTYEDVISGRGILATYDFLIKQRRDETTKERKKQERKKQVNVMNKQANAINNRIELTKKQADLYKKIQSLTGTQKIQLIQKNITDPICKKTFDLFITHYARFAQTYALFTLPRGGIYIGGGIARKMQKILLKSNFRKIFEDNFVMRHILKEIPLRIITNKYIALLGCCNAFEEDKKRKMKEM